MKPVKKLWLSNLRNTRRSLARLIKEYHENKRADTTRFRALIYAVKALFDAFKTEREFEIEERIEAIEQKLDERGF